MSLLEVAGRESTTDQEALNAIRLISRQLEKGGFAWQDLPDLLGGSPEDFESRRIADLKDSLEQAEARIKELENQPPVIQEVVVERIREVREVTHPDSVSWNIFSKLAEKILGKDWQMSPDRFGASESMLRRWQKDKAVPLTFLDKLAGSRSFTVEHGRVEPKKRLDIRV